MGKITLGGSIPGDNNDGLGPHSKDFIDDPLTLVNVVARVAVTKIVTKTETGETYPTLKIHHWEIVPADHQKAFGQMIGDAFGARTGMLELPFPEGQVPLKEEEPFPEEDGTGDGTADLAAHRARGRA